MNKYQNKYRIPSTRLQNWNYGAQGSYFVTVCTKNREHFFGEIINGEMHLTDLGKIAEIEWLKTIEMRPDMNLEMGEFIVMPNHFHAIIIIGENEFNKNVQTPQNKFGPQSKNLASIMRGYKSAVSAFAKKNEAVDFGWQERFYEHIIKDSDAFVNIENYIINNVANWKEDKFFKK